jgi:hypothetical protein
MLQRLDCANAQHGEQGEGHISRAKVFQHIAGQREGQALPAKFRWRGNRIPTLLDIGLIGAGKTFGQAHNAVFKLRAFGVAHSIEWCKFPSGKLSDPCDNRLNQISLDMGEFLGLREFLDPGIDTDGKQLIGSRWGVGVHR